MTFQLGQIVITPACLQLFEELGKLPIDYLSRHANGDWGDCCKEDAKANEDAIRHGGRIISIYHLTPGEYHTKIYIITDATRDDGSRESTCLLLSSEY